jgi:hypothetical protein
MLQVLKDYFLLIIALNLERNWRAYQKIKRKRKEKIHLLSKKKYKGTNLNVV